MKRNNIKLLVPLLLISALHSSCIRKNVKYAPSNNVSCFEISQSKNKLYICARSQESKSYDTLTLVLQNKKYYLIKGREKILVLANNFPITNYPKIFDNSQYRTLIKRISNNLNVTMLFSKDAHMNQGMNIVYDNQYHILGIQRFRDNITYEISGKKTGKTQFNPLNKDNFKQIDMCKK